MTRNDVTEAIIAAKMKKGLKWADIARKLGQSKEWTTAALLGQMTSVRRDAESTDLRGVRRRHHERDRYQHGSATRAESERRSRWHRHEREVPSIQDLLSSALGVAGR